MRWLGLLLSAFVNLTLPGCANGGRGAFIETGQSIPAVSVNIVEPVATVEVTGTFQFHFDVANTTYPTCTWMVNGVAGGNASFGTITSEGLYTAPAHVPTPNTVTVKATATSDPTKFDTATIIISPGLTKAPSPAVVDLAALRQFSGNTAVIQPETAKPRSLSQ